MASHSIALFYSNQAWFKPNHSIFLTDWLCLALVKFSRPCLCPAIIFVLGSPKWLQGMCFNIFLWWEASWVLWVGTIIVSRLDRGLQRYPTWSAPAIIMGRRLGQLYKHLWFMCFAGRFFVFCVLKGLQNCWVWKSSTLASIVAKKFIIHEGPPAWTSDPSIHQARHFHTNPFEVVRWSENCWSGG